MLVSILAFVCGLLLLSNVIRRGSAPGRVISAIEPFEAILGVIAIIAGILNIFNLTGVTLVLAGFVLSASALRSIPRIGRDLRRAGTALDRFRMIIGLITLVLGILGLIRSLL